MSVFEEMMIEEKDRLLRIKRAKEQDLLSMPKGALCMKHIHGREYHYRQWRDGKKTVSKYVSITEVEIVRKQIDNRRQLEDSIKSINNDLAKLGRIMK